MLARIMDNWFHFASPWMYQHAESVPSFCHSGWWVVGYHRTVDALCAWNLEQTDRKKRQNEPRAKITKYCKDRLHTSFAACWNVSVRPLMAKGIHRRSATESSASWSSLNWNEPESIPHCIFAQLPFVPKLGGVTRPLQQNVSIFCSTL